MKLFVVSVEDKPGSLASVCDTIKPAKIKYLSTQKSGYGRGFIKVVTDNDDVTRSNLLKRGFMFVEEPLVLVKTDGSTESIFQITHQLGSSGINIENLFAFDSRTLALMLSPENVEKVKSMLGDAVLDL